jgi:hypothetical protein
MHFPNFRAEDSLFYPDDGNTTYFRNKTDFYQTAQSNIAADGYIQQWPLYVKSQDLFHALHTKNMFFFMRKLLKKV